VKLLKICTILLLGTAAAFFWLGPIPVGMNLIDWSYELTIERSQVLHRPPPDPMIGVQDPNGPFAYCGILRYAALRQWDTAQGKVVRVEEFRVVRFGLTLLLAVLTWFVLALAAFPQRVFSALRQWT